MKKRILVIRISRNYALFDKIGQKDKGCGKLKELERFIKYPKKPYLPKRSNYLGLPPIIINAHEHLITLNFRELHTIHDLIAILVLALHATARHRQHSV